CYLSSRWSGLRGGGLRHATRTRAISATHGYAAKLEAAMTAFRAMKRKSRGNAAACRLVIRRGAGAWTIFAVPDTRIEPPTHRPASLLGSSSGGSCLIMTHLDATNVDPETRGGFR